MGATSQPPSGAEVGGIVHAPTQRGFRLSREKIEIDADEEERGCRSDSEARPSEGGKGKEWKRRQAASCRGRRRQEPPCSLRPVTKSYEPQAAGGHPSKKETAPEDEKYRVPGSAAPPCNVLKLWRSMLRFFLKSKNDFTEFLHATLSNTPSLLEGTVHSTWPMPLPYPDQLKGSVAEVLSFRRSSQQMAVNFVILALNWLHLQKPRKAPASLSMSRPLSSRQWRVVRRLEKFVVALGAEKTIGPSQMGRTAVKVEGLDALLLDLHVLASEVASSSNAMGSLKRARPAPASLEPFLPEDELHDTGEVVGRCHVGIPVLAKEVESSRLSFPQDKPWFNPSKFFDNEHKIVYEDPASLSAELESSEQLPRVQVRASRSKTMELLLFLDRHNRLVLASEKNVRLELLCGAFSLIKDCEKDRLIVDARRPNYVEPTLSDWCRTLGAVSALLQLEIQPGKNLYLNGTDLRDYYYAFRVSKSRSYRNALAFPISREEAASLSCFSPGDDTSEVWYPCLDTLAMGDNNAVELGQCAHVCLALASTAIHETELLTVYSRAPRGSIACGIVIDDVLIAEQCTEQEAVSMTEGEYRLNQLFEEYGREGLTPHPRKTFRRQTEAEFWGTKLNGITGHCRANPSRLVPLLSLTLRTATLGYASVGLLEVLAGSWVSVLQYRRRMMSLLHHIYQAQIGRDRLDVIRMSRSLIAELWLLVALGPVAVTDLRTPTLPQVFLSDASNSCVASVVAEVPLLFAVEVRRHCLSRGTWSRLLTPWKAYLREHEELAESEEIPAGVPLVCHPLWVALAEHLQFRRYDVKVVRRRRHINLLEVQAVLEVERKLAERSPGVRYLNGGDSQVALASLVKGRSSSPRINALLTESLATHLGAGLYGEFGFVPSLSNCADDPTRWRPIRRAIEPLPSWLSSALGGDFASLDRWLGSLGYDPLEVAKLPFSPAVVRNADVVKSHLTHLRSVQKPERLQQFDSSTEDAVRTKVLESVSPADNIREKTEIREHDQEPGSRKDPDTRGTKISERKPTKAVCFPSERRVAPPAEVSGEANSGKRQAQRHVAAENKRSPLLSEEAKALLSCYPACQFFLPGGRRGRGCFRPLRRGFLDLYSGAAGIARALSRRFHVWVLCFDFSHCPSEDLLEPRVQKAVFEMLKKLCFLGAGAAPECCTFSRAVTPPIRSRLQPEGLSTLEGRILQRVLQGNLHADFVYQVVSLCVELDLKYWTENPDGSFLWLLPQWLSSGLGLMERSYRCDMCHFGTLWRKRTRFATNLELQGRTDLCSRDHQHVLLRGRSASHRMCWTRVAQVYPRKLCSLIATSMGKATGLLSSLPERRKLDGVGCARALSSRVGEASHPGPGAPVRQPRPANQLTDVQLVEAGTRKIQGRVWDLFSLWLQEEFSAGAKDEIFKSPALVASVLHHYGVKLYSEGARLYEFRHLVVMLHQRYPLLRPVSHPVWELLNKWEILCPVTHRAPLPYILMKAMFSVAACWGWWRWAGVLLLGFEGLARIGEVLNATRMELVLPCDNLDSETGSAFMKIPHPKPRSRGRGKVQHIKVNRAEVVKFLEKVFSRLHPVCKLYPMSASAFRSRWDKIMQRLEVPKEKRPTPSSIRGGGAIRAYQEGESVLNLLWRMRLSHLPTLEHYVQELAAESLVSQLPERCRQRIISYVSRMVG